MGNLYRMEADGANIHQIGKSTLFEGHGSLLPDGRVIYDRWEYVDRNFGDAQGLWTANPDGTNHAVYYGNNTPAGGVVLDPARHPRHRAGPLHLRLLPRPALGRAGDPRPAARPGRPGPGPAHLAGRARSTWSATPALPMAGSTASPPSAPKYEDPYPLSDKYFLCSRMTGQGEQMGIYLVDVFGNEILLHAEGAGCLRPDAARPAPAPAGHSLAPRLSTTRTATSMCRTSITART